MNKRTITADPLPSPTEEKSESTRSENERGDKRVGESKLNPKQELFCQLYATDREFFGNGVQSYIEAYEPNQSKPNWYRTACSATSQLLSNIKVCGRINELLEAGGLNDEFVDKQLLLLITQNADYTNKLGAMKEYNKLKQRITDKTDLTSGGEKLETLQVYVPKRPDKNIK